MGRALTVLFSFGGLSATLACSSDSGEGQVTRIDGAHFDDPRSWEPAGEALVGASPGELKVNSQGAATYQMPIQVPPGRKGVEPKLRIVYSSQAKNGVLGQGFRLEGLSTILRSPSTRLHDGTIDAVDFDHLDRMTLDGQRLQLVSGRYGAVRSEYRTEVDTFSRIRVLKGWSRGPTWVQAHTKSRLTFDYGRSLDAVAGASNPPWILAWGVSKVTDVSGNYMSFEYQEPDGDPAYQTGAVADAHARGLWVQPLLIKKVTVLFGASSRARFMV